MRFLKIKYWKQDVSRSCLKAWRNIRPTCYYLSLAVGTGMPFLLLALLVISKADDVKSLIDTLYMLSIGVVVTMTIFGTFLRKFAKKKIFYNYYFFFYWLISYVCLTYLNIKYPHVGGKAFHLLFDDGIKDDEVNPGKVALWFNNIFKF